MEDGREYASIVGAVLPEGFDVVDEIVNGLKSIEAIRERPCLVYVGNVIAKEANEAGVIAGDDVPFQEMVASVAAEHQSVDVYLATNGGSGEQISRFVNCLRSRFKEVNFLIPSFCMSAGTLFALSGDRIYMTPHASLGPIDPQVPSAGGRYVPAQALLILVEALRKTGEDAVNQGGSVPWTAVRLIDSLDKTELGAAITASQWSQTIATQYLYEYKFKNWTTRETSGTPVTPEYRLSRANEVAAALVSHERWKNHGHAITRDVLWTEIKLKIDHPDAALERGMVRMWALLTWVFDKTPVQKIVCAANYRFVRQQIQQIIRMGQ